VTVELEAIGCLAVLGLRRSGRPAALLARRELPAARVVALDEGVAPPDDTAAELRAAGVEVLVGEAAVLPAAVDVLVKSPGVPDESPAVREAVRRGVTLWSEVEFAGRFLANRLIGITGTNGKTTTTELTGAIFRVAGLPVAVGGNIGYALAGMPGAVSPEATIVAELSSFQLEHIERFRPDVAVLLNLSEDHIDRHGSYRGYADAKLRIFQNQIPGDLALLCGDDSGTLAEFESASIAGQGRRAWFAAERGRDSGPAGGLLLAGVRDDGMLWLLLGDERVDLCRAEDLALRGEHNLQNSLAAAAAACAAGVPAEAAAETLRTFAGVPHRLQVGGVAAGVTYVNDSKATNVDATLKALTAYSGGVHLILGGYDKGGAFDDLAAATEGLVRQVLLIGATAPKLEVAFAARRAVAGSRATPSVVCGDLEAALSVAARDAVPGDVVLLSPACASWDQYRDYEERGEHFLRLVGELRGAGAS
jgi:UDP-N-acetylmuramoylalanine--D-glutamate ligase